MIVCFKWKQLKKGWEKLELQLLFSSWLDVPLPHFDSPAPLRSVTGSSVDAAPQSWGFITPAPGSPRRLRHVGKQRSKVPDGILINNNTQLLLRWDKPCCKSPPFPRLSVAFEDLLLLLVFISIQSED